jgi:hypothetical protein
MSPLFTTRKRTAEDSRMEWMVTSKTDDTLQRGTLIGRAIVRVKCRWPCRRREGSWDAGRGASVRGRSA